MQRPLNKHDSHRALAETAHPHPKLAPLVPAGPTLAVWHVAIALVIAACLGVVGYMDKQDAALEQMLYCDQVHLYNTTDGEYGWPDYARTYADQCTLEGEARL